MADQDPIPKLRVVEDKDPAVEKVVRLGQEKPAQPGTPPSWPAAGQEPAARLESVSREHFDGRSVEPGLEAILGEKASLGSVEQPWGGTGHRLPGIPYGWFLLIVLVLAGAGFWSLRAMKEGEKKVEASHEVLREKIEQDAKDDLAARELVEEVESVVRRYLAADTLESLLPLVRHPERVRPLIEEEWKARPKKSLKFKRMTLFQPTLPEGKPFWVVRAEVEEGKPENLLLEQTGPMELKVDWETQVGHQPMSWDRYATTRPADRSFDFRIWAKRDLHFSHEFSDPERWRCYRLTAKDSLEHLFGYAPAGSELAKALDAYCSSSRREKASLILRLRFPADVGSLRGVVIEQIVAPRWVHVEPPKDAP